MATGNTQVPSSSMPLRIDAPPTPSGDGNTRVDTAHVSGSVPADNVDSEAGDETTVPVDPETAATLVAQARTHSAQLADYLRAETVQLDQRESHINAQTAELETQMRRGRIWLDMRREELSEREEELENRERELSVLAEKVEAAGTGETAASSPETTERAATVRLREAKVQMLERKLAQSQQRADELEQRENAIVQREQAAAERDEQFITRQGEIAKQGFDDAEFDRRRAEVALLNEQQNQRQAELDSQQSRLEQALAEIEAHQSHEEKENDQRIKQFADQSERLQMAEAVLVKQQAECDREQAAVRNQRESLRTQKEAMQRQADQARQHLDDEKKSNQSMLTNSQQKLRTQAEALEKVRRDVQQQQRETLEMRLVTEQLWSQLTAVASSPSVIQSIAKLRGRLAEEYRIEEQQLAAAHQALQGSLRELDERREQLKADQHEIRDWTRRRQEDLEQQAARLVAREQELEQQFSELDQREREWQQQRRQLEDRTRQLLVNDATV